MVHVCTYVLTLLDPIIYIQKVHSICNAKVLLTYWGFICEYIHTYDINRRAKCSAFYVWTTEIRKVCRLRKRLVRGWDGPVVYISFTYHTERSEIPHDIRSEILF